MYAKIAKKASENKYIQIGAMVAMIAIVAAVLWYLFGEQIRKNVQQKSFEDAGKAGTPEYYAKQIYDAGSGDWYDWTKWDFDEEKALNIACEIGKNKNYQDVIKAFRKLYDRELSDYLSKGLNTDELQLFDQRATGVKTC